MNIFETDFIETTVEIYSELVELEVITLPEYGEMIELLNTTEDYY